MDLEVRLRWSDLWAANVALAYRSAAVVGLLAVGALALVPFAWALLAPGTLPAPLARPPWASVWTAALVAGLLAAAGTPVLAATRAAVAWLTQPALRAPLRYRLDEDALVAPDGARLPWAALRVRETRRAFLLETRRAVHVLPKRGAAADRIRARLVAAGVISDARS